MLETGSHEKYLPIAQELLKEKDADHVLAALLQITYADEFNEEHYNKIENFSVSKGQGKTRIFLAL
jgi:ATP-dependent RNA helicase DeaD